MEDLRNRSRAVYEGGRIALIRVSKGHVHKEVLGPPNQADELLRSREIDADRNNLIFDAATVPTVIFTAAGLVSGLRERSAKKIVLSAAAGIGGVIFFKSLSNHFKNRADGLTAERVKIEDLTS